MHKNTPRRAFLQKTLLATGGLSLLSTQSVSALTKSSPIEGYNPFTEEKTDLRTNVFGKHLVVTGKVYDSSGKLPLKNTLVEVWHLTPGSKKYRHRGKMYTDAQGRYRFVTDLPEKDASLIAKVNFKVSHGDSEQFTSLLLGAKDAYIRCDHWEKNNRLGDKLFPSSSSFLNTRTIQFNISI